MWAYSAVAFVLAMCGGAGTPVREECLVFDPETEDRGHVHASCIVECPNGDLRVVWYENGNPLPPPYYAENKDKSADVRIGGSRRKPGADAWEPPFVISDTFGVSDNNPCMVVDSRERLWLFHATLIGVPDWTWGSCLVRFMTATRYDHPGRPLWDTSNVLVPQVTGIEETIEAALVQRKTEENWTEDRLNAARDLVKRAIERPLASRLGWMPRAHPLVRNDGAVLVPLANENFGAACMAITEDAGQTWAFSKLVPDLGLEQPTVVQYEDGAMTAFFRNESNRVKRSDSADGGRTWGPVMKTELPHPGSGLDALVLRSGNLILVYNDSEKERDRLAVSLSEDRGATWRWTRHIENKPGERFDYPSVIQAKDGALHVTFSYNTKAIKHVRFTEDWIKSE